ncbi:hypothetical protein KsCSTR_10940 [Candidatus Kuenenia stuttgartiensis]|uniref:Uncharacterized protein n=1 Tax=Kuenenia stuttgartiensis TaxID=174633 RepID=Q1PYL6_KUEST|nr:hypothetical protein KsCSTR_10940 [Candidatus Kuenenia stuttgartiensis]CAJ72169.1 unknown protein [Candidatus Kuenenia stuttgartiensis]
MISLLFLAKSSPLPPSKGEECPPLAGVQGVDSNFRIFYFFLVWFWLRQHR